jgi:nucleoredoxin
VFAAAYSGALKAKGMEIVFVSSDKDAGAFAAYHKDMPWPALPFEDRERKARLSSKYKVQGIPTLILLDAKTGEVITTDGRSAVSGDPKGLKFPWKPLPLKEALAPALIVRHGESRSLTFASSPAAKADVLALYFSASWCGPCRAFTPKLAELYKKLRDEDTAAQAPNPRFEVLLLSEDQDEKGFKAYFDKMPWLALDFDQRELKDELSSRFKVDGIPHLVLIHTKTWTVISRDAVSSVAADPSGFPWMPKPVEVLHDGNRNLLGEGLVAVIFCASDAAAKAKAAELSGAVAAWKQSSPLENAKDVGFLTTGPQAVAAKLQEVARGAQHAKDPDSSFILFDLSAGEALRAGKDAAQDAASVLSLVNRVLKGDAKLLAMQAE